jgi:hypothetical protein
MRRWLAVFTFALASAAPLAADIRVTSTTAIEGALAKAMGGMTPTIVMHIKGSKARADVDVGQVTVSTITDIASPQIILLNPAEKTAQVLAGGKMAGDNVPPVIPKIDVDLAPTGERQVIAGVSTEEHRVKMTLSMADAVATSQLPPQAVAAMKDVRMVMNGSMWIAKSGPGVAEYTAFQAAAAKAGLQFMGAVPGMGASGLDQVMTAFAKANGLPYLTEMVMSFEGTGPIVEMMAKQGPIKIVTRVTDVSTAAIPDDVFVVPSDYKVVK